MRFVFLIIICLIIIESCQSVNSKKDAVQKWNISSCKIYSSEFEFIEPNPPGQLIQEFRFRRDGYVNELIRYGLQGEIIGRFDITGTNNPFPLPDKPVYIDTVLTLIEFDNLGAVVKKEVKHYNSKGLLVSVETFINTDSLLTKNTYEYNKIGLITEDIYWNVELQKPQQVIRYVYEFYE